MLRERYFARREVHAAIAFAESGGVAIHRNLDIYDGKISARGMVMTRPFLHVIGRREVLREWAAANGVPEAAIQPEKRRTVAHIDVFGEYADRLMARVGRRDAVRAQFERFTAVQSELYGRLSAIVAADDELLDLAAAAPAGQPAPNLLLGTVHLLLLRGLGHPLAAYFPSIGGSQAPDSELATVFADFCDRYGPAIRVEMARRRVQTNEVTRSAVLLPCFATIALEAGRPLALFEIGASAGLNLVPERWAYDYGHGGRLGAPDAAPVLHCRLRGDLSPILAIPEVAWRLGVDLHPVDLADAEEALWLRALVWPDEPWRAETLLEAIRAVQVDPPPVVAGDAAERLTELVAPAPADAELVVFSSFSLYQFESAQRESLEAALDVVGRGRAVHHLTFDWVLGDRPYLDLETRRPGSPSVHRRLAAGHDHGTWLEWLDRGPSQLEG